MKLPRLAPIDWLKALAVGVTTSLLLSAVMVPALRLGISPLPEPLGLAFAQTVLGHALPLPVGLLFHVAYVTFWSVVYVALCRDRLLVRHAALLGLALWLLVLLVFFPIVGWGLLGLGVGPALIVGSLVPHVLFVLFLWGLARVAFRPREARTGRAAS